MIVTTLLLSLNFVLATQDSNQVERKGEHQVQMEQQRTSVLMRDTSISRFAEGIDLVGNGRYEEAVRVFKEITAEYPNNSRAYFNLGVIYKYLRHYECANIVLRKAYELNEDPRYNEVLQEVRNIDAGRKKNP
ncbi:MAG: tetratricopeptide repeat protein [Ignavibacteria bacterium]|nr:tetratricopeptide repeat protein [Ignavibacteria bacterium]